MPFTITKPTKRSRRANPYQKKMLLPGCVITKVRRPKERQKRTGARLAAPYEHVVNAGYTFGGVLSIDIGVAFVDGDKDTIMLEAWIADNVVMEEAWIEDEPQGNGIPDPTSGSAIPSRRRPRSAVPRSTVPSSRTPYPARKKRKSKKKRQEECS